jgi:hypothetical protein
MTWPGYLASLLLMLGAGLLVDSQTVGPAWLNVVEIVGGALCLLFVVPLTVEEARRRP